MALLVVPIGSSFREVCEARTCSNNIIPQNEYSRQRRRLQRSIFDEAKGGNFRRFDRLLTDAQKNLRAREGEDAGKVDVNFQYRCFILNWFSDVDVCLGDC